MFYDVKDLESEFIRFMIKKTKEYIGKKQQGILKN